MPVSSTPKRRLPDKLFAPKEREIAQACIDVLLYDGWRHLRTDPVSDKSTVDAIRAKFMATPSLAGVLGVLLQILKSCIRGKGFGEPGMADSLFIRYLANTQERLPVTEVSSQPFEQHEKVCVVTLDRPKAEVLWIEWKRPGGVAAPHQLEWIRLERSRGALVWRAGENFTATYDGFLAHYRASGLNRRAL